MQFSNFISKHSHSTVTACCNVLNEDGATGRNRDGDSAMGRNRDSCPSHHPRSASQRHERRCAVVVVPPVPHLCVAMSSLQCGGWDFTVDAPGRGPRSRGGLEEGAQCTCS